jgi:anti-sigma factor RsiW
MNQNMRLSLLSAYLDGEVSSAERAVVEAALVRKPKLRRTLRSLDAVRRAVGSLPKHSLPTEAESALSARFAVELRHGPELWPLLSAYADDELDAPRRATVENLLAESPEARAAVTELKALSTSLHQLPAENAPAPALDAVAANLAVAERPQLSASEAVSAWLDGELTANESEQLQTRLEASGRARAAEADFRRLRSAVADLQGEAAPAAALANVFATLRREAATSVAANETSRTMARRLKEWLAPTGWAVAASLLVFALFRDLRPERSPQPLAEQGAVVQDEEGVKSAPKPQLVKKESAPRIVAPGIDEPWIDEDPPEVRRVVVGKPLGDLEKQLQPGEVVSLDGGEVTFICVNVRQMYDRLQVVLALNHLAGAGAKEATGKRRDDLVRIEIDASADQVRQVVAQLRTLEDFQPLVANLSVQKAPPVRESTGPSKSEAIAKSGSRDKLPEKMVPPNPALVNVPPRKSSPGGPADVKLELPKLDPPKDEAPKVAVKEPPPSATPAPTPANGRVRVAFVLLSTPADPPRPPAVKKS